jgi:ribonuclease T1
MTGRQRYRWVLLLLAAVILVTWLLVDGTSTTTPTTDPRPTTSETTEDTGGDGGTDPDSGLPIVQVSDLPPEAAETLDLIDAGEPFPEERDGATFENREDLLPDHPVGYYKEYTVPTPGSDDRGARRIVLGRGGELYYTGDHYSSFSRIAR